ncbi:DUF2523 domain-containing protein [Massilia varians]|uniref:DUF2523 domain-containing protein n=1 Tax=Massilia varians TaxID=457921 RepID=UPI002552A391|nr:DUF2523 domain-containing protein [Massilia varians]MDK6078352.1 DUF2523 domain-containing protein [Massilia varians]
MMNLFAWAMTAIVPLAIRVVAALGFSAVTYTGVTALVDQLVASAQQNWSSMPAAVLQLCALSGIPQVLGMIFGAYMARVAMWAAVGAARYVLKT